MALDISSYRTDAATQITAQCDVIEKLFELFELANAGASQRIKDALAKLKSFWDNQLNEIDQTTNTPVGQFPTLARQFDLVQHVAHCIDMLEVAARQRAVPLPIRIDLAELDDLIVSCYEPVSNAQGRWALAFAHNEILAIFFQDRYLSRPAGPVPYITLPNFTQTPPEGARDPKNWMAIGHEVGHQVYRQLRGFRDEVEITIIRALSDNHFNDAQRRLWLGYAEEAFADIYGVLVLGQAFLYTHHPVLLYAGNAEVAQAAASEDDYIKATLFENGDTSHPTPQLRSRLGAYTYQSLISPTAVPAQLVDWETNVVGNFTDDYDDELSPRGEKQGQKQGDIFDPDPNKKLPQGETEDAMRVVVDTILDSRYQSLGCTPLRNLVQFTQDELDRERIAANEDQVGNASIRITVAAEVLRTARL